MIYKFIDSNGTFQIKKPQRYGIYLPLTDKDGRLLSAISPQLAGDIKADNDHFLNLPQSIEDTRNTLLGRREFFLKAGNKILRLSQDHNDVLEGGMLYQKLYKQAGALQIEITNFVPHDIPAEVMWVKIKNSGKKSLPVIATSFIPLYGRSEKNLRDHRHVSSLLNRVQLHKYGVMLKPAMIFDERGHKENENIYFVLGCADNGIAPAGQFPTFDSFFGQGDILRPDAIYKNIQAAAKKIPEFDGKETCGALRFKEKTLAPGQTADFILAFGISGSPQEISGFFARLNSRQKAAARLDSTKKYWQGFLGRLAFDFGDPDYDNWLKWVTLQPALRKLYGCSFLPHFDYGKGGRGWRDLWQDALALLLTESQSTRKMLLANFCGVRLDGSNATIVARDNSFLSDRNKINRVWMDHGVWPYLTLRLYLHRTGDISLLNEKIAYFRDNQLNRAKAVDKNFNQPDYLLRGADKKIYAGSVLEHLLVQNLVQFFNVGNHNVTRLECADWNDGLDMAEQRGESAAFNFMYAHNLNDLCLFLEELKKKQKTVTIFKELLLLLDRARGKPVDYENPGQKQARLQEYFAAVNKFSGQAVTIAIDDLMSDLWQKSQAAFDWLDKKTWLGRGFYNGYYDNQGLAVEGTRRGRLRMMLQSQVFAILSSGAPQEKIAAVWQSIKKYLQDKKYGGFRLNTDFGSIYMDFGRAFGFSYGDKENGAFFSHMNVMLAHGLYKQGFINEANEALTSIYNMAKAPTAQVSPCLPEYFNGAGRGLYLYLTGSASWFIYTLLEQVAGIQGYLGDVSLAPKLTKENFKTRTISVSCRFAGKKLRVTFVKGTQSPYRIKQVLLEGRPISASQQACLIRRESLAKIKRTSVKITVLLA